MHTKLAKLPVTVGAVIALMAFTGIACAQTQGRLEARIAAGVKKLEGACGEDIKKYCNTVSPSEGRLYFCIQAHEDKISGKCDVGLYEASRNLERALDRVEQAADACWNDIEQFCAHAEIGGGRVAQCLVSKQASLNPVCKTVVGKMPAE